jgi:hypothetical protein
MIISNRYFHKSWVLIFVLLGFISCVDSYDFVSNNKNKILVVEGLLTDNSQNPDTIKIQYSIDFGAFVKTETIESVNAFIVEVSTQKKINLIEKNQGYFLPPAWFKVNPNEKYILKFTLPDNQQYESTPQEITQTPPIEKIYDRFNAQSSLSDDGTEFVSSNEIFVDFQDDAVQKNFYLWRYTHYERLQYCVTCDYKIFDSYKQICIEKGLGFSFLREPYYDYECENECYAILKNKEVNVFWDNLSNGRMVQGRLVARIPLYSFEGCLVEIEQICISPETYSFYKILESQSQNTGGLADTPPAAIVGNIRNINNTSEKVVGYFGVANIQRKRIWIDRAGATGKRALILGHKIVTEPPTAPPIRPPAAKCKPSATRTNVKPEGWQ